VSTLNKCPYCKRNITPGSSFCINCGGDLRKVKQEAAIQKPIELPPIQKTEPALPQVVTTIEHTAKKFSTLFNILVLVLATCCIFGFIYFSIQNKLEATADKRDEYVEIIDNLYRNKKYKFRIKFSEGWQIEKGNGPNVLVKASSGNGSSINLVVKDLGAQLGSIEDIATLDEWAEFVYEKFPTTKIIEKKETHIDNRKAFYVKYEVEYDALDMKTKMTMFSVAIIRNNFLYVITASADYDSFDKNESILSKSVRTFVVED